MPDTNATVATLTMAIEQPQFNLLDQALSHRGKPGIVMGINLIVEPVCCWVYFLQGKGIDNSISAAGCELKPIELGTVRKPRIKRPEFKLFDALKLNTGEKGFICGAYLFGSGRSAEWQYNIIGVGISQYDYFRIADFQQVQQAA